MTARRERQLHRSAAPQHWRRATALGMTVAPLMLIATTSCSGDHSRTPSAHQASTSAKASPAAPASDGANSPGQPSGSAASPTDAGGSDPAGAAGTRCQSAKLKVEAQPGDSAAGKMGFVLVFTNTGSTACTMRGYPGVSFVVSEGGNQVNDPADRTDGAPVETVTLEPGKTAHANLRAVRTGNFDEGTCKPVAVAGFRIYPPGETAALFAKSEQQACSAKGVGLAQVSPVQAGSTG